MRTLLVASLAVILGAVSAAADGALAEIQKLNGTVAQMVRGRGPGNAAAAQSLLLARRSLMAQLIKEDPESVRSATLAAESVDWLRGRVTARGDLIEEQGEWNGSLEVLAEMDFEHHKAVTHRYLRSARGRFELFGGPKTFSRSDRMGGAPMRIKGIRSEALIAVDSVATASSPAPGPLAPVGTQNYAVLVVTSPGNPTFPAGWNLPAVQNIFFGSSGSTLNTFWQEASYGLTSATGQVFGPFAMAQNYTCSAPDTSDSDTLRQNAIAATLGTVDFTQFNRVAIVFPNNNCSYGGLASIGGGSYVDLPLMSSIAWFPIYTQDTPATYVHILAHEGGHNLGLSHANSEDYGSVPLGAPGTDGVNTEYGDPYSVMGLGEGGSNGLGLGQYSAQHKALILGWLDATGYQQVTSSGTYNVTPLEEYGGTRGLRILRDETTQSYLWIEARQPIGPIDSTLSGDPGSNVFSGALVHFENPDLDPLHTYLLDFNPVGTPNNFYTSAMTAGQTWADPYSLLHLTINSSGVTGLSVNVSYDSPCATLAVMGGVIPVGGGTGSVKVTANSNCAWSASTGDSWIMLGGTVSGQGNGTVTFTAGNNTGTEQRNGIVTVQRQSVPVVQQGPGISGISVSPNSGSGTSGSFTFQLADTSGYGDIDFVNAVIGPTAYDDSVCSFEINTSGYMWVLSHTGQFLGPVFLNAPGTKISNGSCTIFATGSSVSGSGELLSVTVNVQFAGTVSGQFGIYAFGHDSAGFTLPFSLGNWTVPAPAASSVNPVAAFLDQNGAPALTFNSSTNFPDAGGFLIGAPGVAEAPNGDTYIVGLDGSGGVHLNSYSYANGTWNGWQYSGGILDTSSGLTAAVDPNGVVWFTGRDIGNRFWINSWNGASFGGWILLDNGIFDHSSIPQIAIASDGSVYVIGKDIGGRVWSNSYVPATLAFTGWIDRQGIITGQPSVAAGQDGMVYVGVRSVASESPIYIKQIPANNGAAVTNWLNGGGQLDTDPSLTSANGTVYVAAMADGGTVYLNTFSQATQTFGGWTFTNGILSDMTIADQGGKIYIAGRDGADRIYWYSVTGNSWFFAGGAGVSSTVLAGAK